MTFRGVVTTYKARRRSNNTIVMVKMISSVERNVAFWKELKRIKLCHSPYIIKYIRCYENNNDYRVWIVEVLDRIDYNGKL